MEKQEKLKQLAVASLTFRATTPVVEFSTGHAFPYLSARFIMGAIIGIPLFFLLYYLLKNWPTAVAGPIATGIINLIIGVLIKK